MTHTDILEQLYHLPTTQRLAVVESVLHQMREELAAPTNSRAQLQQAAEALRQDYLTNTELTAFSALDLVSTR